jgi:hypothetical protein
MAMSVAAQKAWMAQWRAAGAALAEQRKKELQAMSAGEALAASEALLSLALLVPLPPSRVTDSGLTRQQALFHRRAAP